MCTLFIPVLLGKYVDFLNDTDSKWQYGLLLTLIFFFVQAAQSLSLHRYYYVSITGGLQYKSALTAGIF